MKKQKYSYCKKTLVAFTEKIDADMRFFCRNKGIKSKSELIRQAVAEYMYPNRKDEPPERLVLKQLQDILSRCQLSISFK